MICLHASIHGVDKLFHDILGESVEGTIQRMFTRMTYLLHILASRRHIILVDNKLISQKFATFVFLITLRLLVVHLLSVHSVIDARITIICQLLLD